MSEEATPYYTRKELWPINCDDTGGLTEPDECCINGEINEENMDKRITQLTARHIAKCLDDLGNTLAPSQQKTIKHWFWNLSDDLKDALKRGEQNEQEAYYNKTFM